MEILIMFLISLRSGGPRRLGSRWGKPSREVIDRWERRIIGRDLS